MCCYCVGEEWQKWYMYPLSSLEISPAGGCLASGSPAERGHTPAKPYFLVKLNVPRHVSGQPVALGYSSAGTALFWYAKVKGKGGKILGRNHNIKMCISYRLSDLYMVNAGFFYTLIGYRTTLFLQQILIKIIGLMGFLEHRIDVLNASFK